GSTVEIDKILLIADGENIIVGNPMVEGASVTATVKETGKDKKILVYKYKAKTRYSVKIGHRQDYTSLTIDSITPPGEIKPKRTRRTKKEVAADGA
ncbi:50S ribosomal protein L21, partial [Chloroflexota bacterium]